MDIAVQMWSVREDIAALGLGETLKQVASAGFKTVEICGFYDLTPDELKGLADKYGIACVSAHIGYDMLDGQLDTCIGYVKALGLKNIVIPWLNAERINDIAVIERLKKITARLGGVNCGLGYHNHAHELEGTDLLKKLASYVPDLKIQFDIYFAAFVGVNAVEYIKNNNYVRSIHVKELSPDGTDAFNPPLGEGVSDTVRVIKAAIAANVENLILEFEKVADRFGYMREAGKFLKLKTDTNPLQD